ncbi:hypothetical protein PV350_14345 [Streptomyces sp. PA03-6a]|nr:hypothetical protein [Streptomyces sp. PA03-6a]
MTPSPAETEAADVPLPANDRRRTPEVLTPTVVLSEPLLPEVTP